MGQDGREGRDGREGQEGRDGQDGREGRDGIRGPGVTLYDARSRSEHGNQTAALAA